MLVIIGNKYYFNEYDINLLKEKFEEIIFLPYYENDAQEAVYRLDTLYQEGKVKLVVLNIDGKTNIYLQKFLSSKAIKYINVDKFLEKYLFKCLITKEIKESCKRLEKLKTYNKWQFLLKKVIDLISVVLLAIITAPIALYSLYKIKKESPGSIIFKQTRVGLNNKEFTCYKFRSMHENSYHDPYTKQNDNRVFKWGNFMRKTRVDELPQMWNIIKGDMHLIGPRAEWNILVKKYQKSIPCYSKRHLVRPGITGWAQVNYPYGVNENDAYIKLMYDLYYIKNWSLWLEIKTILLTIGVILSKKGL